MTPINHNPGVPCSLEDAEGTPPPPYDNDHPEPQYLQPHGAPEAIDIRSTQGDQQHEFDIDTSEPYLHDEGNTTPQPIQDQGQPHLEERDVTDGRGFSTSIRLETIRNSQQGTAVHVAVREAGHRDRTYTHDAIYYDTERHTVIRQTPRPSWGYRLWVAFIFTVIASGIISGIVFYYVTL